MCHPGCCGVWQVDAEALGIPGYRRVVKHPMDLGTIHARLAPGGVLWQPASCLAPKDQQQALHVAAALGSRSRCPCTNLANPVSPLCLLKFSPALHACLRLPGCLQAQPRGGAWLPTRAPLRWRRTCSWCLQTAGATTQEPAASGEAGRQAGRQAGSAAAAMCCPALPCLRCCCCWLRMGGCEAATSACPALCRRCCKSPQSIVYPTPCAVQPNVQAA